MLFTATCLFGLETFLSEEIESLGYRKINSMDGRITFEASARACAEMNIYSRFAERLYWHAGSFSCYSFDDLFEGTKFIPWENLIGKNDSFPVKGHAIKSDLFSIPDCQKIIKKAIATRLGTTYGLQILPETGIQYQIEFFLFKNEAHLMVDLSGNPLHKRGYRPQNVVAPLRETLACAIAKLSRPRENVVTWDPFCGSGTIAIETVMMMTNRAPGLYRSFAAEQFPLFGIDLFKDVRLEAESKIIKNSPFKAYASDIDPKCIDIAKETIRRAGVTQNIDCFELDATKIKKPEGVRGTIVTNPPYGERMMTKYEVEVLYKSMGKAFENLTMWQFYILTSHEQFPKLFGRRADKIRKLYNGMIPCYLFQFYKNTIK